MNVANLISDKLKESINKFGTASLVVPGGSSPIKIFKDLSQIELAWSKVQITLVDDRLVDPQNENSNQKLLSEYFFINKAKNANFFPLSEDLIFNKKFKIPFDVTLIGMGEDGHFASYDIKNRQSTLHDHWNQLKFSMKKGDVLTLLNYNNKD